MKFGLPNEIIRRINNVFSQNHKIESAIIYGSRAKGTYHTGSDIDLVLTGSKLVFADILQIKMRLEELNLPYEIDLSILEQLQNENLVDHIERIGVLFYRRD